MAEEKTKLLTGLYDYLRHIVGADAFERITISGEEGYSHMSLKYKGMEVFVMTTIKDLPVEKPQDEEEEMVEY